MPNDQLILRCTSLKLDTNVYKGFGSITWNKSKQMVYPKGDIHTTRGFCLGREETLEVEFEDLHVTVPEGKCSFEAIGTQGLEGDTAPATCTWATRAAVTGPPAVPASFVEVLGPVKNFSLEGRQGVRFTLKVYSHDGVAWGITETWAP